MKRFIRLFSVSAMPAILAAMLFAALWVVVKVYGDNNNGAFQPIYSFQDDREAKKVNDNFKRVTKYRIVYTSCNAVVGSAFTRSTYPFTTNQADLNYVVSALGSWSTNFQVLQKTTTGFVLGYSSPAATGQTLDVSVAR